ncbi:HCP-like superfamily protein [Klebsormidium nitens]|uniref:HCP-like superfamily protein n=1 Tax=Klebsormidium nitens TaxID=105231 RepID=A0A1Y1ILD5_KLENI|nr:HCP-like superfamily protein [Klebsormidium nitens]|eukprot:GAQ91695.1 HCP-like superfamily protein [Klebsormidium nitens]
METLPQELLLEILQRLSKTADRPQDLCSAACVSKSFHSAANMKEVLKSAGAGLMLVQRVLTEPRALDFLSKIRNAGSMDALYVSGMLRFYSTNEHGIGADLLVKAAEQGHAPALYECAITLTNGSGGDKLDVCHRGANELLYRAAALGYEPAAIELSMRIRNGWGFQKDRQLGTKVRKLAEAEDFHEIGPLLAPIIRRETYQPSSSFLPAVFLAEESRKSMPGATATVEQRRHWALVAEAAHRALRLNNFWYEQKSCNNGSCGRRAPRNTVFRRCTACWVVAYCSLHRARKDRDRHRAGQYLIISGVTQLAHDPSNAFLGTRLIESQAGQDLILRPGALARVCIDGDLMLSGDLYGFDPGSNSMANTMLLDSNAVVLGTEIRPDYDSIDQGGLLMRGAQYNSDPKLVSFLWNKNGAGVPYWNAQGGNFRIERRLQSGVDVSFTFAIQEDFSLVVLRSIASGVPEPCIGFAPADDEDELVRGNSALFLKENLLNIGLRRLPKEAQYVLWIDDDLTFYCQDLKERIIAALQEHPVVQVFETCRDLDAKGEVMKNHKSFAAAYRDGEPLFKPAFRPPWANMSHTGYAWAARRSVLDACGGLLETAILGSADGLMARAMVGKVEDGIQKGLSEGYRRPIIEWQERILQAMNGEKLGCVVCEAGHSWHGAKNNRQYATRGQILVKHSFDPIKDLVKNDDGVWEFKPDTKPKLQRDIWKFFQARKEDEGLTFDKEPLLSPFTPTL